MAYKVRRKMLKYLTRAEYEQCYNLNLGNKGSMKKTLAKYRIDEGSRPAYAYMIENNGKLIAWALRFYDPCSWQPTYGKDSIHFYTAETHRRMGLGKLLFERIEQDMGSQDKFMVFPWGSSDNPSISFFNAMKGTTS